MFVGFLDEAGLAQAFQGSVERGWPKPDLPCGAVEDLLHDAVAVLLLTRRGKQDVKPVRLEGEEGFRRGKPGRAILAPTDPDAGTDETSTATGQTDTMT